MAQQPQTRDGASWTAENGWSGGLPCIGAIHPREYRSVGSEGSDYFEVIVIGAGYAGLVAARDLALQGSSSHYHQLALVIWVCLIYYP